MIYHELRDRQGRILSSNLEEFPRAKIFEGQETVNITIDGIKNVYREYSDGVVRLVADANEKLMKSSRTVSKIADGYSQFISTIKKVTSQNDSKYAVLYHNLVTTHAKLQGEVGSVISDTALMRCDSHAAQQGLVREAIKSDSEVAANAVLQISKRIVDLHSQIKGFDMLRDKVELDIGMHNVKRILLNILYPFYEEFNKLGVEVHIDINDEVAEQNEIGVDYEIFNVAMHHFFNNIVKYAQPYSRVTILFQDKILRFLMMSVKIEKDERKDIFDLGVSGKNVGNLAGDGIGMYMVKKALDLHQTEMKIIPTYTEHVRVGDFEYVRNEFAIDFSRRVS